VRRALALLVAFGSSAVLAQSASLAVVAPPVAVSVKPVDPAALAAARDMLQVVDIRSQLHALMPSIGQAMAGQMQRQFVDNKVPEGLADQFGAAMQAFMGSLDSAFTPAVIDQLATIYAQHFSESELRRLSALLGDPVMLRYRAEIPKLLPDEMPILLAAMKPQQEAFQAKMKQITADWIKQHPEDKPKLAHPNAS
jgi:hypothetical protein